MQAGADYQIRETYESALLLGQQALAVLGATPEEIEEATLELREIDSQRFELELAGETDAARLLFNDKIVSLPIDRREAAHPEKAD